LKKRTKKLLRFPVRAELALRVNQHGKSLLVLFFKKELFPFLVTENAGQERWGVRPWPFRWRAYVRAAETVTLKL
jgi:hypothetical protein